MVVLRCKIAVVGEPTSGKTALTQMVHSGGVTFPKNYMMTLGADFCVKELRINEVTTVEVFFIDIGGQPMYVHTAETYLDGIAGFILVYDVSNKTTFETAKKWVDMCRKASKVMPGVLVANKMDLREKAEVTASQGEIFSRANQLKYFEASALRGSGLMEPVEELVKQFVQQYDDRARMLQTLK